MSDEHDKLVAEAKAKLSKAELNALIQAVYNMTRDKVNEWICEDLDRISRLNRSENVIYCRILWLIGQDNELKPQVSEWEASRIQELRKARFSIGELARVFQRSRSTIHAHIQGPLTRDEQHELWLEDVEPQTGE